jgi:AAA15 family ATPase/GTPase
MKIRSVTIENFRGYKNSKTVIFDDLTLIVGKNDVGKSTVLEALNIFLANQTRMIYISTAIRKKIEL